MLNAKKVLMLATASILALGLTACGKDNYNGQYTGSEIKIPQAQTTGGTQNPYGYYGYQQQSYRSVTATLSHNGDIVTGQYDITNNYGNTYPTSTYPTNNGSTATESYRLEATAKSANRLEEVRLIPMNSYSGYGCVLTGTLESVSDGVRLQGTLNPMNQANNQYGGTQCLPTQITLDRVGGK